MNKWERYRIRNYPERQPFNARNQGQERDKSGEWNLPRMPSLFKAVALLPTLMLAAEDKNSNAMAWRIRNYENRVNYSSEEDVLQSQLANASF